MKEGHAHVTVPGAREVAGGRASEPSPQGQRRVHESEEGRTTHRGSISTRRSWEAWFTQGTLEQTRLREQTPRGLPGLHTLHVPPRLLSNTSVPKGCSEVLGPPEAPSHLEQQ